MPKTDTVPTTLVEAEEGRNPPVNARWRLLTSYNSVDKTFTVVVEQRRQDGWARPASIGFVGFGMLGALISFSHSRLNQALHKADAWIDGYEQFEREQEQQIQEALSQLRTYYR